MANLERWGCRKSFREMRLYFRTHWFLIWEATQNRPFYGFLYSLVRRSIPGNKLGAQYLWTKKSTKNPTPMNGLRGNVRHWPGRSALYHLSSLSWITRWPYLLYGWHWSWFTWDWSSCLAQALLFKERFSFLSSRFYFSYWSHGLSRNITNVEPRLWTTKGHSTISSLIKRGYIKVSWIWMSGSSLE